MSTAAFAPPDRELVLDRYRPLKPVGRGGSGSVWLARDERSGREVALKIVPREGKRAARAMREMEAASRLRHDRCVRAFDFGGDSGHVYIAYEYVRGSTVRELLRAGKLTDADTIEVAAQVLDGLAHAHARGIVHRDVKPSNVLVEDVHPLSVRVLDFGLAQFDEADTLTAVGDVPGTLAYIAPERLSGQEATPRSDVWAVGVMLWEALAGQHPFWGVPLPQVAATIAAGAPDLRSHRPDLPARLVEVVHAALSLDPARRPTAQRLAHELREAYVARRPRPRGPRPAPPRRSERTRPRTHTRTNYTVQRLPLARTPAAGLAAATVAGGATLLPFWPTSLVVALVGAAALSALVAPRAALALALAVPVLPFGNLAQGAAIAYAAIALAWLALMWRDARSGLVFALGAVAAPLGLLALLPLLVQGARGGARRAAHAIAGVAVASLTGAVGTGVFPLSGDDAPTLPIAGEESPTAVIDAVWGAAAPQSGLVVTALVLAFTAVVLPWARSRGARNTAALLAFQALSLVLVADGIALTGLLAATAVVAAVALTPAATLRARIRPLAVAGR